FKDRKYSAFIASFSVSKYPGGERQSREGAGPLFSASLRPLHCIQDAGALSRIPNLRPPKSHRWKGLHMNWITNYVRPKINSLFSRREVPENLWTKCPECGTMLFHRELETNLNVCSNCDHHMAISPRDRFTALFDGGIFTEVK